MANFAAQSEFRGVRKKLRRVGLRVERSEDVHAGLEALIVQPDAGMLEIITDPLKI